MTILKTLLGSYIPTFFEMHVATRDDDMTINKMSDGKRPKTDLVI